MAIHILTPSMLAAWVFWSFASAEAGSDQNLPRPSSLNCTWVQFPQPLLHFGPSGGRTFSQRICAYDKYWSGPDKDAPIFFYTGNESPLEAYINNTGLMWESAQRFGALLLWVEHRYFGGSIPQLAGAPNCLSGLSVKEALADFAAVIDALHEGSSHMPWRSANSPVIVFGGSYGGMLSAWFRMTYPEKVAGSIAASAPIWGFPLTRPALDGSFAQLTNAATEVGGSPAGCAPNLKAAWVLLRDAVKTPEGRALVSESMGLCTAITEESDVQTLLAYLQDPLFNLAEGSFPFATNYITFATFNGTLAQLPPWPVRQLCRGLASDFGARLLGDIKAVKFEVQAGPVSVSVDWDQTSNNGYSLEDLRKSGAPALFAAVAKGLQVWYNVTGTEHCVNWQQPSASAAQSMSSGPIRPSRAAGKQELEASVASEDTVCSAEGARTFDVAAAWGALCCNDGLNLVNTVGRGLGHDLFWPPNLAKNVTMEQVVNGSLSSCSQFARRGLFGLPEQPDEWARSIDRMFGGKRIEQHSNIFFSNGDLDPWAAAGVLPPGPSAKLPTMLIHQGGHHLDLFFETESDPQSVKDVRSTELEYIGKWIAEHRQRLTDDSGRFFV